MRGGRGELQKVGRDLIKYLLGHVTDTHTNDSPVSSVCCGLNTVLSPSPKLQYLIIITAPKMAHMSPFTRYSQE